MEHRKKKSSHGGDAGAKRGKGGGGAKRVLVLWADAQHDGDGDDDSAGEEARTGATKANQTDRETSSSGSTAAAGGGSDDGIGRKKKAKNEERVATEELKPLVNVVTKNATTEATMDGKTKQQQKQTKNKEHKHKKPEKVKGALLQKIQEDKDKKKEKKEKKKKAKQEKRARKQADVDRDDHINADVAFDSEEIESDDDDDLFGEASANMFEAHGFVMIDIENELDELALIADMATGEGAHSVQGASKKEGKKKKKQVKKTEAAFAKQAKKKGKVDSADISLHAGNDLLSKADALVTASFQEQKPKLPKTQKQKLKKVAGNEKVHGALGSKAEAQTNELLEQEEPKLSKKQKQKLKKAARAEAASVMVETSAKSEQTNHEGKHAETTSINVEKKIAKFEKKDKKAKVNVTEVKIEENSETVDIRKERGRRSQTDNGKRKSDDHNSASYEEYVDRELVLKGLEDGTFLQGKLRVNSKYRLDGYTMLCFCRIKSWSTKYKSPMGEFVKTVGEFSGIESGISAILTKHGLLSHTLDFDSGILEDLDEKYGISGEKWVIPDEELQKRRDFRKYQIFSIDPYNARDLDDALHKMLDGVITSDNVEEWEEARRPIVGENPLITNASVIQSVKDLWTIGKCRREMRFDTGAISLNNVKIVFSLDAKGNPVSYGGYQLKDSNRLVEEYMLMANYLVAQQLLRTHGPLAFIRNHPQPIAQAMEQTLATLQENKLEIDGSTTKSLSESLEQVRVKCGETAYIIAQAMIIKPMKPAEYMVAGNGDSAEAWRHYALNIPYYTHFTSPIRRYADVVVHRLLQESVTCGESLPVNDPQRDVTELLQRFTAVSQNCNEKKVTAKYAETECDLVLLCAYVKHHGAVEVTGIVMSMGPQSFTVYIMGLGLEERVFLKNAQITGTWDEKTSNLAIRLRSNDNKSGKNSNDISKPIQLSFMKKLRLVMDATNKMPLKLTFSVVGEAH
uniref:RNB domain-containing protein n=1 Tax=Globisporangium ultimum (strain ATCC 200006 / CBS 805.95 / DAOM BR144) TaxID=431595 RepID=K3WI87_GLOUD